MSAMIALLAALLLTIMTFAMDAACMGNAGDMANGWPTPWDRPDSPVATTPEPSPPAPPGAERVQSVRIERGDAGYSMGVSFTLPDYCHRFEGYGVEIADGNIEVALEIVDESAGGGIACAQAIQELIENIPIAEDLAPGETYTVTVNGRLTNSFTAPEDPAMEVITVRSPIESVELLILESYPPQYNLLVLSALPKGSSCSWFNGYDIASPHPGRIEVEITHHEATGLQICTADYPAVETVVPLGSDFEPGREYEIVVNGESVETFQAY